MGEEQWTLAPSYEPSVKSELDAQLRTEIRACIRVKGVTASLQFADSSPVVTSLRVS